MNQISDCVRFIRYTRIYTPDNNVSPKTYIDNLYETNNITSSGGKRMKINKIGDYFYPITLEVNNNILTKREVKTVKNETHKTNNDPHIYKY